MTDRRFAFRRILMAKGLPEPDDDTMQGLLDIVDEGVLGASNHVALALPLVARVAAADRNTALDEALELARFIGETRGLGAPIVANALNWQIAGAKDLPGDKAAALLAERSAQWDTAARKRRSQLIARGAGTLAQCRMPLIYDYSSTVEGLVRAIAGQLRAIIILESRAIDGGRRYMTALRDVGVEIVFLPDAALDHAVARADAVLLGAESVTIDGGVTNTIGSTSAARSAVAYDVPVYGAADLFKVGTRRFAEIPPPAHRRYDFLLLGTEVASTEAPELETVPPDLVTAILTEIGPVAPADLASALDRRTP